MKYRAIFKTLLILAVSLMQISLSGCAMVSNVESIGLRVETLDIPSPPHIYVASNGAVAIEVHATYKTPKWFSVLRHGHPNQVVYSRNKYIIGDSFAIMNSIAMSQPKGIDVTNAIIQLTHYAIVSAREPNWKVYPSRFEAERSILPEDIRVYDSVLTGIFDYYGCYYGSVSKRKVQVSSRSNIGREKRQKKCWWAIPTIPLFLPALAIDIVTSPIQYPFAMSAWDGTED